MHRRTTCLLTLLGLLAGGAAWAQSADPETRYIIRVHVTDKANQIPVLADMHLDLAGIDVKASTADFVGTWRTYLDLLSGGFDPIIVDTSARPGALESLSQYLDPAEISARLDNYQAAYPTLARKFQIATTENGRPEYAMKISDNVDLVEDEPVVFYVGQHHAREVMTQEITMDIIDYLLTRYATDPHVKAWVDGREIWVVPTHNPDGSDWVFTQDSFWRKNRRNNGDGTFGVDLNRNYPYHWNFCSGSSGFTGDDTYRGPSPGSEPETQGFMALARAHRPAIVLSYHTYSELVIHPVGCPGTFTSENRMFRDVSSDMAVRIRNDNNDGYYSNGEAWELLYAVDGEMSDWFYGELGTTALTIEANNSAQGFQPDYNTWRDSTVNRNRPAWQYLLDRVDGPAIRGHATDACTGAPLVATLALDEITFVNDETPRTSQPDFGRYEWITTPGSWHLNVSKTGYQTQDWPVEVGFTAAERDVRLVPSGSRAAEFLSYRILDSAGDSDGQVDPGETVTMPVTAYATGGSVSGLTAVLSTSDPDVTVTDPNGAWPSIGAGASAETSDPFAFTVASGTPDGHVVTFMLSFSSPQGLCATTSTFTVRVTKGAPSCPAISEPLDANPGWTIQNTNSLGWAFGAPAAAGGPPAAHTGVNVYGTNLTGNYGDSSDYKLITTAFDLTNLRNTELRFWRWLDTEVGYDAASIDVSTDGVNFTNVWSGFGRDADWELYRYDISSLADGQPTVYVRFRLQSDSSTNQSGFYIDDVSICGETKAPAPRLVVTSWSLNDGVKTTCTDHDGYADAGEIVDLTVNFQNTGNMAASAATAILSSSDPRIGMINFRAPLGTLAAGGTTNATFRFKVADAAACKEPASFQVDFAANAGDYTGTDTKIALSLEADNGTPVPDTTDNFEGTTPWTLTGEWVINRPRGKGGAGSPGGFGNPDPSSAFSGQKVLGVDLSGTGVSPGNYENNLTNGITATSPVYNCSNSTNVHLDFERWLGVESSQFDHATIEAWNGSGWQTVWSNPASDLSDSSWQAVSYDVSQMADGNPNFQIRFKITSNNSRVFCGWNIDDLHLSNGYTPVNCEGAACAAGCTPTSQIGTITVSKPGGATTVVWPASASSCHESGGAGYRVYRSTSPAPRVQPPSAWPGDSFFVDVTTRDVDGSASNTSFTEPDTPRPGEAFFYLVTDMGSSGAEGPKGWQGF